MFKCLSIEKITGCNAAFLDKQEKEPELVSNTEYLTMFLDAKKILMQRQSCICKNIFKVEKMIIWHYSLRSWHHMID